VFFFVLKNRNIFENLNLDDNGIYTHFIDNYRTLNHRSIVYGIRELNFKEINDYCLNKTLNQTLLSITESVKFSSNYKIRSYQSGCFYLDSNNNWQSDGLLVSILDN